MDLPAEDSWVAGVLSISAARNDRGVTLGLGIIRTYFAVGRLRLLLPSLKYREMDRRVKKDPSPDRVRGGIEGGVWEG